MHINDRISDDPITRDRLADERIANVQSALQRRFRIAGRGSVSRVQRQLRLGAGYFKNQRRTGRRRVDLKVLFRALEVLDVDPCEFFAGVLGPADPVDEFKAEAAALRRKLRRPAILALEKKRRGRPRQAGEEIDLAALDALRDSDPRQVLRRAKAAVPEVADRQIPKLLGIYASACRSLGRFEEAQAVLGFALDLAQKQDNPALIGDLLQRAAYVLANRGDAEKALAISERAALCYVSIGDVGGIGKTLVDQGAWLASLDRWDEEVEMLHSALKYLTPERAAAQDRPDLKIYRSACLLNMGVAYRKCGDLENARRYAALARDAFQGYGPRAMGKLMWLQASIARESGRFQEAESFYHEALELLRPVEPIDAAIATIDLVRTQLERGREREAYTTAKAMVTLLHPLEQDEMAAALITELVRCALNGRGLTLVLLKKVARRLEAGRVRHAGPARRSRRS